jgi:hypothetical protein
MSRLTCVKCAQSIDGAYRNTPLGPTCAGCANLTIPASDDCSRDCQLETALRELYNVVLQCQGYSGGLARISDSDGRTVALCDSVTVDSADFGRWTANEDTNGANAALIVRAVNNLDALIEAAEFILYQIDNGDYTTSIQFHHTKARALDNLRAALAAAKG